MKRLITIVLAALLLLTACQGFAPRDREQEPNEPAASEQSPPDFSGPDYLPGYDYPIYAPSRSTAPFNYIHYGNTVIYYNMMDYMLYYSEMGSGVSYPLCARPECMHNDETCDAYNSHVLRLFVSGDSLYYTGTYVENITKTRTRTYQAATRRKLDGSGGIEILKEISKDTLIQERRDNNYLGGGVTFNHREKTYNLSGLAKVKNTVPTYELEIAVCPLDYSSDMEVVYREPLNGPYSSYAGFGCFTRVLGNTLYYISPVVEKEAKPGANILNYELRSFDLKTFEIKTIARFDADFQIWDFWVGGNGDFYIVKDYYNPCKLTDGEFVPLYSDSDPDTMSFLADGITFTIINFRTGFEMSIRDFDGNYLYKGELPHEFVSKLGLNGLEDGCGVINCYGNRDEITLYLSISGQQHMGEVSYRITPEGLVENFLWFG